MSGLGRDPAEGTLEQVGGQWRLRFVRRLAHPPEKVWQALTEEQHLAAWFPTTIEGELRPGAPLEFRYRGSDLPAEIGEVIACEPPRLLEFTWGGSADGTRPAERCRFELVPEAGGCTLVFTTTYDEVGKSARDAAGWHVCFDQLERHLAGAEPIAAPMERWKPLNRLYAQRFGPEAATIGPPEELPDDVKE
ncbi:MAG TPA: SRPBCC family protein [Longimicrobiales bacterium]